MDEVTAFRYRWCFEDSKEALYLLQTMTDVDEVPTKRNGLKGHRYFGRPLHVERWPNGELRG